MDSNSDSTLPPKEIPKIAGPIELLKSSLDLFINNWKILVPVVIVPSVISFISSGITYIHSGFANVIAGILAFVSAVFSIILTPTLIGVVHRIKTGSGSESLVESYRRGFGFFWSFLLILIINTFVSFGSVIIFIVPGIIVAMYISLYSYAFVVDGKKGFTAFTESYSLVYKRWWPVLGRFAFMALISIAAWFILAGLGAGFGLLTGIKFDANQSLEAAKSFPSFASFIRSSVLSLVGVAIFLPIMVGYMYNIYSALKSNRLENVQTNIFKRWLVTFLTIGIVVIPIAIILAVSTLSAFFVKSASQNQQVQQTLQKVLMELEQKNSTSTKMMLDSKGTIKVNIPSGTAN